MMDIGICGLGVVGSALQYYFNIHNIDTHCCDKFKNEGSLEKIDQKCNIVFICIPINYNDKTQSFDISQLIYICRQLNEKIIVIKSTVLPQTTVFLQQYFPNHQFLFNPEFLTNNYAIEQTLNPERQIVGYTNTSKKIANDILELLPNSPYNKIMTSTEAEMVKFFNNTFNSTKIIFANEMYNICKQLNIDYENVAKAASKSSFIGTYDHLDVWQDGFRGYSGKCLPKDMKGLINFAHKKGVNLKLHQCTDNINKTLTLLNKEVINEP